MNTASVISDMLRLYRDGVEEYQPTDLERESGDPQASLRNLRKINLPVLAIFVNGKAGCLVSYVDGEQYYATGLSLLEPEKRAALVEFASVNGFGPKERLTTFYDALAPDNYTGPLPVIDVSIPRVPRRWQMPQQPCGEKT